MTTGALAAALAGLGGVPGRPGVLHVVELAPAEPFACSVRGAVLLAGADVVRCPARLPWLATLAPGAEVAAGTLDDCTPATVDAGAVVVQVVAPGTLAGALPDVVGRLRGAGVPVELVPAAAPLGDAARAGLPLAGRRVLNLRATHQAPALSAHVRSLGGEPVEAPSVAIAPGDEPALDAAVVDLPTGRFAACCLTSPNGVDALAAALARTGLDARALAGCERVAAVGPGTARALAERLGVVADLVPEVSTTAGLAGAFPAGRGEVLLPRADIATNTLADELRARGYTPVEIAAYRTVVPDALPAAVLDDLAADRIDLVPFLSSSMVRNFVALVGDRPWRARVVAIGPVTAATCDELGVPVHAGADRHDLEGLVDALCRAAG